MKSFKTLQLDSPEVASKIAYDPHSQSLIVSGAKLSMISDLVKEQVQFVKGKRAESLEIKADQRLKMPYLRFVSDDLSNLNLSHSGLALTCLSSSSKYIKCKLNQSYASGTHYFEVICPISCSAISFGLSKEGSSDDTILKLKTSTPRVVGILIDLEQYVYRIYTDTQLSSAVKEAPLSPGVWTPFVKIKKKGNVAILNPFCTRFPVGYSADVYRAQPSLLSYQYSSTVALLNLPDQVIATDDITFLKEKLGLVDTAAIRFCSVAKDKDRKCLKVGIIDFKEKEAMQKGIAEWDKRDPKEKIEYCVGEPLWKLIQKIWNKEKIMKRTVLGVKYKVAKPFKSPVVEPAPEGIAPAIAPGGTTTPTLITKDAGLFGSALPISLVPSPPQPGANITPPSVFVEVAPIKEVKAEEKKSEEKKVEEKKTEEKKQEKAGPAPKKEEKNKFKLSIPLREALKSCLQDMSSVKTTEYKEKITGILRGTSSIQVKFDKIEKESESVEAMYLSESDNILLIKGEQMKIIEREHGSYNISDTAFYNVPSTPSSQIILSFDKKEAAFLSQTMKWRALGDLLVNAYSPAVEEFVSSLTTHLKEQAHELVIKMPLSFLSAKVTVDYSLKALSSERLYRSNFGLDEQKEISESRIFALTSESDLSYLFSIFSRLEETLWSMCQHEYADKSLSDLWLPVPSKINSAYYRCLSFQHGKERLPKARELADAGLIFREDNTMVHYEDPNAQVERAIQQIVNKTSLSDLWEELERQLPESKMLTGQISNNVPLSLTLNNFSPSVHLNKDLKPQKVDSIKSYKHLPVFLSCSEDGNVEVWSSRMCLSKFFSSNMKASSEEVWKTYGAEKIVLNDTQTVLPLAPAQSESELFLDNLFVSGDDSGSGDVSVTTLLSNQPKEIADFPKDISAVAHPMLLVNEKSIKSSAPLSLASIVTNKDNGKLFLKVRKYCYFTKFFQTVMKSVDGHFENPFDNSTNLDKESALENVFQHILEKASTFSQAERENIFALGGELVFPIQGDNVLAAYALPVAGLNQFHIHIITRGEKKELLAQKYLLKIGDKAFTLESTVPLGFEKEEVKVEYNDEILAVISHAGVNCYSLSDNKMTGEIPIKLEKLQGVHLQGTIIIVQQGKTVELFNATKEKSEKKEAVAESTGKLIKDVKPEEISSIDLTAYGSAEGTIAIGILGKSADGAAHVSAVRTENGMESKKAWTVVGKEKKSEHEFELMMTQEKEVESLEVELSFQKNFLTSMEYESINSVIEQKDKKAEQERKRMGDANESHLPLVVVWHKGATFNNTMSVSKILISDGKEFKSNYPQPAFIFAHQHEKQFIVKKCVVKSPILAGDKCHPIGSGVIYIANHLSAFKNLTHKFAKETEYNSWLEKRKQCKVELQPYEPAGFFQMGDANELSFTLNTDRACKYIYLLPTAFRSKPTEIKQFASFPLSIEYFGITGTVLEGGASSSVAYKKSFSIEEAKIPTNCSLEIYSFNQKDSTWLKLANISSIMLKELQMKEYSIQLFDKERANAPQVASWKLIYEEKELHKALTSKYKIKVIHPSAKGEWEFSGITAKMYTSKKVERQGELFKHVSSTYLWKCMNDPELFGRVNKALCELVCNPDRDYNDRIKTLSLLRKIVECGPEQLALVRKHIPLDKFIKANIYQEQTESFALKFLQLFNQLPDFASQLQEFVSKELADIEKIALKPSGISGFKSIVSLVIPKATEHYLHQIIGKIYDISTKDLESILSEDHIFLRTRLGVNSYPLSPFAWTPPAHGKREEKVPQAFGEGKKVPASLICGYSHLATSCRFLLDCVQIHDISTAILYFKKDSAGLLARFTVSVYGVSDDAAAKQILLVEKEYPHHIWERVTSNAYFLEKTKFDDKDELESLIIPLGSFIGRYIIIDVTFKRAFEGLAKPNWTMVDYLKDGILAEVYGLSQQKEGRKVPEIDACLQVTEQQKTQRRVGHSATYERIQNPRSLIDLYQFKIEGQAAKVDYKQQKGEENVSMQLGNLQKQLQKEIKKHQEGQAPKEAVLDLVAQIESLQRIQCQAPTKFVVEGHKCVEYLIQVCIELSRIVSDIVSKNNQLLGVLKKQTACNVVTLIKVLFRDFVVFNSGSPREEMLAFIQNILLPETTESEWVKLILEILEDFLSKTQTIYSQRSVIDCLEKFNIPEGEILSFLAKKMKLKEFVTARPQIEERKRSNSRDSLEKEIFPELSSSLILAIKSLRKLQIEDKDAVIHRGIICNYCGHKKPIVGVRYKCGHCPNINICSKSHCIKKHSDEKKDHVLIAIPKPLPYSPTKIADTVQYKVLLPPMKLLYSSKIHDGIECDHCGIKNFEGTRYLCGNCDYYNLCEKCYTQDKYSHTKTHVFLRLPEPLVQSEKATPKALIAHLDPELYPLQKSQPQEELKAPLELKRSVSTVAEKKVDYDRLDIDQTLQIAYRICVWVCHSHVMGNKQKSIILKLSADLLGMLLKLSSVDTVSEMIQEDTQLEYIISSFLSIEDDKTIRQSLIKLIAGLKNVSIKTMSIEEIKDMPASDRGEYLIRIEKTLTIRSYLSTCLHQILKSLIDNAPKGKTAELFDIDNLAMLLDSYVSILDSISGAKEILKKYKVIKDEDKEIVIPALARSMSLPISTAKKQPKTHLTKPSLQLALGLTALLESLSPHSMGSTYGKMWEIVLKILSKINMKQVIEAKLFERLMSSFFLSSTQIQETIYRQLLDISSKMIQFPNMSTLVINLMRSTLESAVNTPREEMAFYICRGWLDILITGGVAKTEKKEDKKENKEEKKIEIFSKLDPTDLLDFFAFASSFLMAHLNFGCYKGIMGGKYHIMYRAVLACKMFKLLFNITSKDGSKPAMEELVANCKDSKLYHAYNTLLIWVFLNYNQDDTSCQLTKMMCKTSNNSLNLFKYVSLNEGLCKVLLGTLQEIVITGDKNIAKRVDIGELRISLAVELNERFNKLLKRTMKYVMASTTVATYFAFDLKGFDFLFNRLGISHETQIEREVEAMPKVESDLMEGVKEAIQAPQENNDKVEQTDKKEKKDQFSPSLIVDEDFAKDMNLIECTGETNLTSLHHINWCTYKGGQRSKIYTKQFKPGEKYEVVMAFELKKLIEVKEIQLSFINFWGMDNFEHVDISSVTVEIGVNKNSYSYFCTLEKAIDKSLEVHGVTIFGRNMNSYEESISKSDPVGFKLNSLKNARAKYIRFVIRTGVKVAFSGTQASKSGKQKAIGVNYFSIIGYDFSNLADVEDFISGKNQKVAYKLLNMFQMKTFRGCLKEFATNVSIANQLKVNFHTLASLMTPDKPTIEPFLIALCTHNAELGKWILQELIRSRESKGSALFMVQICLSNLEKVGESQELVLSYIFKELAQIEAKGADKPELAKSLSQFILHYISLLYIVSPLLKADIQINVTESDLLMVLKHAMLYSDNPDIKEAFVKLFLVLVRPPARIVSKINPVEFVAKHLLVPKDQRCLLLASYLACFDKGISKKIYELVPSEISLQIEQAATDQMAILLNLTLDSDIKQSLAEKKIPLLIYQQLKNPLDKQTYMHHTSQNIMQLADELIKQCVTGYPENEKALAEEIIKDLNVMKNIEEKDALSKLILNLMKAENTRPVCLYNYDSECEQWKSMTGEDTLRKGKKRSFFIDTPLLQQKHKDVLLGVLRDRIGLESEADKVLGGNWKLSFKEMGSPPQNSADRFKTFFDAVGGKGPFILFMSGMSEGKRAIVGGFTMTSFPQKPDSFQNGQTLEIKSSPESVFFYYSENKMHHFEIKNKGENFGYIYVDYANCGACVLGNYFLSFSYSYSYSNSIGSLSSLKCIDGNVTYLPYSFFVDSIEVWSCEQDSTVVVDSADKDPVAPLTKVSASEHPWYSAKSPYQVFRSNAVFNIPSHITIKETAECIVGKTNVQMKLRCNGKVIDEHTKIETLYTDSKKELCCDILDIEFEIGKDSKELMSGTGYKPETSILAHFEKLGGYISLIDAAKSSLAKWKNLKLSQMFQLYLEELMQFSKLADFFKTLLSNKRCKTFLFDIMAGTPDRDTNGKTKKENESKEKRWEDEYNSAVTYCYTIISQLFANFSNLEIREQADKSGFISLILTRLQKLSGENPRKWEDSVELKKELSVQASTAPDLKKEDPNKKKARKGVGYSTQVGEIWDVDKYMKSKKAKNQQIIALISIIANFISCEKWTPDEAFIKAICESALLPLLEASLSSGSLLEMAKESELVLAYLDLIDKFREKEKLAVLLIEIDPHFVPVQREPLYQILKKLNELSSIFLKCMEKEKGIKQENEGPKTIAENIESCYKKVMRVIDKMLQEKKGEVMKNILSMPLPKAYKELLKDLRFGYMNMRDDKGKYKHYYHAQADQEKTISQAKLVRLAQELADLSNALPDDHTNAIYIRVDDQRTDYMKAVVMGASGTPYAHGAFEYDIYCPGNYPNESPKMTLITTGSGAVRFNPNLYHDGKVCLSLLGTWRGTATENWDPKFSTILQVLMSLQAIVMSEEVYFNEPGFEGEIGRPEGEKKNEAYSNIVRYCNIKFAMINQIKNPLKGFEAVIKRHFYIKKDEILKEVYKWVEYAEKHDAAYEGLVYDHNSEWCNKFKQSKTKYKEMLTDLAKELEQALTSIEIPKEISEEIGPGGAKELQKEKVNMAFSGGESIEGVDIAEDTAEELVKKTAEKENKMNMDDAGVKDRWSRYIGAIGLDAVAKQAKSCIFVSGAGGLGIEISKNMVLSGCKEFMLQDAKLVTKADLGSQFYLQESDIGKPRSTACIGRLQQLNYYTQVTANSNPLPVAEAELDKIPLSKYNIVILTECDYKTQIAINDYCRKHKIGLIIAEVQGVMCKIINDFGEKFTVMDSDGEEPKYCMIKDITNEEKGVVTAITGQRHGFANDDTIMIKEAEGMTLLEEKKEIPLKESKAEEPKKSGSINETIHTVKFIDPYKFSIGDTRMYSKYLRNGVAKQVKLAKDLNYKMLKEVYYGDQVLHDSNLSMLDFAKSEYIFATHLAFEALDSYKATNAKLPGIIKQLTQLGEWNLKDSEDVVAIAKKSAERYKKVLSPKEEEYIKKCIFVANTKFHPLCALLGGLITQEIVKGVTGKFTPINQIMYYSCPEILPPVDVARFEESKKELGIALSDTRYNDIKLLLGEAVFNKLADYKIFLVGVGAIGCELLKNYAMLGLGSGAGKLLITDPDVIEVSNLNRQFLFKEKHLRKPKSTTAAASIVQMNPSLKGKVVARMDKVHEGTSYLFNDEFFGELNVVTNALDNVTARRYIDSRCVTNKTPLLESGTLGAKGHVQVVIPYKTESYSSQNDPEENTEIPVCTLKMFPEEAVHCIEWARDKFEKLFNQHPKTLQQFAGNPEFPAPSPQVIKNLKLSIRLLKKKPATFNDCIKYARLKFQKYFVNDIKQLLHVYPLDSKTKEGQFFWTLPKRPPHEKKFNPANPLHADFIVAVASLFARTWGMEVPANIRTEEVKQKYAKIAAEIIVPEYVPNDKKAKEISAEVEKAAEAKEEAKKESTEEDEEEKLSQDQLFDKLLDELDQKMGELATNIQAILPEEFEKDNDLNFHIDFIYGMANCRADCYGIEGLSWINTKIKAGRIIPALASTTAVVAALQTMELVKLAKGIDVTWHRNAFVNLALPSITLSEPGPPKKTELTPELKVTLWDRWEIKPPNGYATTFAELIDLLKATYKLEPRDFFKGNKLLYLHATMNTPPKANDKAKMMKSRLDDALDLFGKEASVDLNITFCRAGEDKLLTGVPTVRLIFQ